MKTQHWLLLLLLGGFVLTADACSKDEDNDDPVIEENDKQALLYMLEEEKLARDVYMSLYDFWGIQQFGNIQSSEQTHMDAVMEKLDELGVEYEILAAGQFSNSELQSLYETLMAKGTMDEIMALEVGATIEDLDIFDLINYAEATQDDSLVELYEFLQCGSRNHMRAFVNGLEMRNASYVPKYISAALFTQIIDGGHENCL